MEHIKMPFGHIDISKPSVCFTWDDNYLSHSRLIAPEFIKRGLRCTFYINPGEAGFEEAFAPYYRCLSDTRFEIGSHGFKHDNYSNMPIVDYERELEKASSSIKNYTGIYPATFAFPYHDYNEETLGISKRFHIETRNTLRYSKRFAIRTSSSLDDMFLFISECVSQKCSMVFSGHAAVADYTETSGIPEENGYEPVRLSVLCALLDHIKAMRGSAEVLTFEQAALKQYITDCCDIRGDSYILNTEQADWLSTFEIDAGRLSLLI